MTRSLLLAAVLLSGCSLVLDPGSLPEPPKPGAPTGLAATAGNGQATLSWNPLSGDVAAYTIHQGAAPTTLAPVGEVGAGTSSWIATGLTNGTTYYFAVAALDSARSASDLSESTSATPFLPDTSPPLVALFSPANGANGVPLDAALVVTFSETMDPGTVTVSATPSLVLGPPTWSDGNMSVSFEPFWFNSLAAETNYALEVAGADPAGNATTAAFHFRTVGVPPTLDATTPSLDATGVPTGVAIQLVFSEPMNPAAVEGAFGAAPAITCAWSWTAGNTTATCTHALPLAVSTTYTVTVGVGAADANGTPMTAASSFSFTTASAPDTTPPTVSSHAPTSGATAIARASNISVTFSEPVDKTSAQVAFSIVSPAGYNEGSFSWSANGLTMTYDPPTDFPYGQTVQWRVNTSVKDLAGNYMAAQVDRTYYVIKWGYAYLYGVPTLDGYLGSTGFASTTGTIYAGDGTSNEYWRGFLSFDLNTGTPGGVPTSATAIVTATLYVYQYMTTTADPYAVLGNVIAQSVYYGSSLEAADFSTPVLRYTTRCIKGIGFCTYDDVYTLSTSGTAGYRSVTVTGKVSRDLAERTARGSRSQFRLKFSTDTNGDSAYNYAGFYPGDSSTNKPYLYVTYEYP